MDTREHLIRQAAGMVDDQIERTLAGEVVSEVDKFLVGATLNACLAAGIHPEEINALRTTCVDSD